MTPRLQMRGVRELLRRGWRVRRDAAGLKCVDRFVFIDKSGYPDIRLRWSRASGFRLDAVGNYLDIQLKLAEFFEIYYAHPVTTEPVDYPPWGSIE